MSDKTEKPESNPCWVVPPASSRNAAALGVSISASAHDLSPEFVKQLTAIVRTVQGIDDLTVGGDVQEGRCGVLSECVTNRDRCPVLKFCGTNA